MLSQKAPPASFEFSPKWRGCLAENLCKISHQVNPGFAMESDAVNYVERMLVGLLLRLLDARPSSVADLKALVLQTFPTELIRCHSNGECQASVGGPNSRKPAFHTQKMQALLKEVLNYRPDLPMLNYALAILEYIAADILRLTGRYVKNMRHTVITFQDLKVSLTADPILMDLFFRDGDETLDASLPHSFLNSSQLDGQQKRLQASKPADRSSCTYEQTVKDLIYDETQYLRDLNMLILVFRNAFAQLNERDFNADCGRSGAYDNFSPNFYENEVIRQEASKNVVDLDRIFSNALDVREFTTKFLALLEDTVEMNRDNKQPSIGTCFSEMAQAYEFDVYHKYIEDVMNPFTLEYLYSLLDRDRRVRKHLQNVQPGFDLAVKYVLPRLLIIPILHCSKYFECITHLSGQTKSKDDATDLSDAESLLLMLRKRIELHASDLLRRNASGQFQLRFVPCGQSQLALAKISELVKQIDGFDTKAAGKNASEFILEGTLGKYHILQPKLGNTLLGATDTLRTKVSRTTERYTFLFDTMIVLCKPLSATQLKRAKENLSSNASSAQQTSTIQQGLNTAEFFKFRFKECFQMRRVEIIDREDTEDLKNAFEIRPKSGHVISQALGPVLLFTKTAEEKQTWMASLILLQTRGMLERMLDASLAEEENRIPLYLPSLDQYRFAEKDSEDNIIFEDYVSSSGLPIVRGATLPKLIERLTPNQHADPVFCKMLLTTFRSFCDQRELLNLLIERFHVPDPPTDPSVLFESAGDVMSISVGPCGSLGDSISESKFTGSPTADVDPQIREIIKKFRKKYAQPVQIRVLNVIKHWVDDHWYDFNQDQELLECLKDFLFNVDNPNYKHITKWAKNIRDIIARKEEAAIFRDDSTKEFHFISEPLPVEWYLTQDPTQFNLMTLHPVEIARQVTLLEFELYRAVKPFELVDASFTKKDKYKRSPQLTKLVKHSTNFTYWLELCVVNCQNLDERVAVINRILEVMCVFDELNNFNGLIEIYGALLSAAINRLAFTWERLDKYLLKRFGEIKQLYADPRHRNVRLKLKNINPPCVPYFGTYLTSLTYLNENKTFLKNNPSAHPDAIHQQQQNGLLDTASIITVEENLSTILDNNPQLINVAKCRKIYEIIGEIQLYQDQAYCLRVEPSIRGFFESLNPLQKFNDNANDLETYLFDCSLKIEPKNVDKAPYFPPSLEVSTLKSPGIKLQKAGKIKHLAATAPPSSIFTPLHRLGKEKSSPLTSVQSTSQSNNLATAPASPTSSKDAPFSIIDIEPGKPPRYIRDVHTHSTTSPKEGGGGGADVAASTAATFQSRMMNAAARSGPLSEPTPPPAIPPRPKPSVDPTPPPTTSSSRADNDGGAHSASSPPPPLLPRLALKSTGPPRRQHASRFNFPDVRARPSRQSDDAVAAAALPSSSMSSTYDSTSPPVASATSSASPPPPATVIGVLQPPLIPPRRSVNRPPAPLSSTSCALNDAMTSSATPSSPHDDTSIVGLTATSLDASTSAPLGAASIDRALSSDTADDVFIAAGERQPSTSASSTPPPLPPRSWSDVRNTTPPPRPPKTMYQFRSRAISNAAVVPPPLPPKTYRSRNTMLL